MQKFYCYPPRGSIALTIYYVSETGKLRYVEIQEGKEDQHYPSICEVHEIESDLINRSGAVQLIEAESLEEAKLIVGLLT